MTRRRMAVIGTTRAAPDVPALHECIRQNIGAYLARNGVELAGGAPFGGGLPGCPAPVIHRPLRLAERHHRMLATRRTKTWILKYLFPGGLIPAKQAICDTAEQHTSPAPTAE